METTREANVTITLEVYTDLICKANDYEKVKAVLRECGDNYIGSDTTALLKALCGIERKEKE